MTRNIVEQWNSADKVINVKVYDDGAVRASVHDNGGPYVIEQAWLTGTKDFKGILIAPKPDAKRKKNSYYLRHALVLAEVSKNKINSVAAYRKVWSWAGYEQTPRLESNGYVVWISGTLRLTTKGAKYLSKCQAWTWDELASR